MIDKEQLAEGARNLLVNCAGLTAGSSVLIAAEDPSLGWYDAEAPSAVIEEAHRMGINTKMIMVGAPDNKRCAVLTDAMDEQACTIFFARKGDQDRFESSATGKVTVMSYARNARSLASIFGRGPHQAFWELKESINNILLASQEIHITCPRGTDYVGSVANFVKREKVDVSVRRFPVGVPMPISSVGFSGRIAVADFLTPTGSKVYSPSSLVIPQPVYAEVADTRIVGFTGDSETVDKVNQHYHTVSQQLSIKADVIHSWHAGIHPGCGFIGNAIDDPDLWSNSIFCNPRFLHLHTCGDYAPGEIALMVKDPTIRIDGQALWDVGRLRPEAFPETAECLRQWPEIQACFDSPCDDIGI